MMETLDVYRDARDLLARLRAVNARLNDSELRELCARLQDITDKLARL